MSISVVEVSKGSQNYVTDSWNIKEEIRANQGYLHQSRGFFNRTFLNGDSYIAIDDGVPVGFGIVINDSYLALLGVKPANQGNGIGRRIMEEILDNYERIECHTRVSNENALEFYKDLGFVIKEYESEYYNNNEDAAVIVFESEE